MVTFVPGIELSRQGYHEVVRPILDSRFPGMPHAAALLGRGSEVLGFDDETSMDHDWGPRVLLFLADAEEHRAAEVGEAVQQAGPRTVAGRPVVCELWTVRTYLREQLEIDIDGALGPWDWLTLPEHGLRMFSSGALFHDEVGLQAARDRLAYYPRDVWLYLLVAGWWRVHPEANLVGRAGQAGDELGSSLIGSRLVADLMRLCFLMERQYAPYSKWFGTAFSRLACGAELTPVLWKVMRADTWQAREAGLLAAYEKLAELHNQLGLTDPATTQVERLWDRPFQVAWADFPGMLSALIEDREVTSIVERWPYGPVDQFRDLLWPPGDRARLMRSLR